MKKTKNSTTRRTFYLSLIFALIFYHNTVLAQQDLSTYFKQGVNSYQNKDYTAAEKSFSQGLEVEPNNAELLTNLGLVEYQLNNKGKALGYFRRALEISPELEAAQDGIKFVNSQLKVKDIPHQSDTFESIHTNLLQSLNLKFLLLMVLVLFLFSGWIFIKYFSARIKNLKAEEAMPDIPIVGIILLLLFIVITSITSLKIYDSFQVRGTIIKEKISVQSAPGENQSVLFDIYEGLEVLVKESNANYVLINYPGGMSGWIKKDDIMISTYRSMH